MYKTLSYPSSTQCTAIQLMLSEHFAALVNWLAHAHSFSPELFNKHSIKQDHMTEPGNINPEGLVSNTAAVSVPNESNSDSTKNGAHDMAEVSNELKRDALELEPDTDGGLNNSNSKRAKMDEHVKETEAPVNSDENSGGDVSDKTEVTQESTENMLKDPSEQNENPGPSEQNENHTHHHHKPVPHHHHHYDPKDHKGPISHIHAGNHIHLVQSHEHKNEQVQNELEKENSVGESQKSNEQPKPKEEAKPGSARDQILDIIKSVFPQRRHLGSLVYNPTTTWLTLQTSQLTGLKDEHFEKFEELRESYREKLKEPYYANSTKYIPMIPNLPVDYINYLLEIKIPYRFIKDFKVNLSNGTIVRKRELWGGVDGVYTDDSDILAVLAHLGFFNDNLDLKNWNESWSPQDIVHPTINEANDIKGDLSVTILLLPALASYESNYANGINSRSWRHVNKHDGLSYAVYNLKWEIEGSYLRDKSFFKRYQTELSYETKYLKQKLDRKGWNFNMKYYREIKETIAQRAKEQSIQNPNIQS